MKLHYIGVSMLLVRCPASLTDVVADHQKRGETISRTCRRKGLERLFTFHSPKVRLVLSQIMIDILLILEQLWRVYDPVQQDGCRAHAARTKTRCGRTGYVRFLAPGRWRKQFLMDFIHRLHLPRLRTQWGHCWYYHQRPLLSSSRRSSTPLESCRRIPCQAP